MTHESEISKCGKVKCSSSHINVSRLFFGTFLRLFFGFHRFRVGVSLLYIISINIDGCTYFISSRCDSWRAWKEKLAVLSIWALIWFLGHCWAIEYKRMETSLGMKLIYSLSPSDPNDTRRIWVFLTNASWKLPFVLSYNLLIQTQPQLQFLHNIVSFPPSHL